MAKGVKLISALMEDEHDDRLLDATRRLCSAFSDLLNAAQPENKEVKKLTDPFFRLPLPMHPNHLRAQKKRESGSGEYLAPFQDFLRCLENRWAGMEAFGKGDFQLSFFSSGCLASIAIGRDPCFPNRFSDY